MTVYVIHAKGTDMVKIGYTKEAESFARCAALQTASPYPLVVLVSVRGAPRTLERQLHFELQHKRTAGRGREWFNLDESMRSQLVERLVGKDVLPVERAFAPGVACTPVSPYAPVVFGTFGKFEYLGGYLGSYDDDDEEHCPEHTDAPLFTVDADELAWNAKITACLACREVAVVVVNGAGVVRVPYENIRPATPTDLLARSWANVDMLL